MINIDSLGISRERFEIKRENHRRRKEQKPHGYQTPAPLTEEQIKNIERTNRVLNQYFKQAYVGIGERDIWLHPKTYQNLLETTYEPKLHTNVDKPIRKVISRKTRKDRKRDRKLRRRKFPRSKR